MTNEDNKAIAQHCIDAINRQDAAAMTEVLSPKWVEEFTAMFPGVNALGQGEWMRLPATQAGAELLKTSFKRKDNVAFR